MTVLELLLMSAIIYAAAEGVESKIDEWRHDPDREKHEATARKLAASGKVSLDKKPAAKGTASKAAAPAPSGFSAFLGRHGARATARGVVSTRSWGADAREAWRREWPDAKERVAQQIAERKAAKEAQRKEREAAREEEARRRRTEAAAAPGPPPTVPPMPSAPPPDPPGSAAGAAAGPGAGAAAGDDEWGDWDDWVGRPAAAGDAEEALRRAEERELRERAERRAPEAAPAADPGFELADFLADQRRMAKQSAVRAEAEDVVDAELVDDEETGGQPSAPPAASGLGRGYLRVVRDETETSGGHVSSSIRRSERIGEVRTLGGLLAALAAARDHCTLGAEEGQIVAADDRRLLGQLDAIEAQLTEQEVDDETRADIAYLRELIAVQTQQALAYAVLAQQSADLAVLVATAADYRHGGIREAVVSSPIDHPATREYYEN